MKKFAVFVVLAMVLIGSCAAQSASNDAQRLVGTWVTEGSNPVTLVLNANGKGTWSGQNTYWGVSISGELIITIHSSNGFTYFLSPDSKIMIYSGLVFIKK
jgi:hypothetical protein